MKNNQQQQQEKKQHRYAFSEGLRGRLEWYVSKGLHRRQNGSVKSYPEIAKDLNYGVGGGGGALQYLIKETFPSIAEEMRNRKQSGYSDRVRKALKEFHSYIQRGEHLIDETTVKTLKRIAEEIGGGMSRVAISLWVRKFYPELKPLFKKNKKKFLRKLHEMERMEEVLQF